MILILTNENFSLEIKWIELKDKLKLLKYKHKMQKIKLHKQLKKL